MNFVWISIYLFFCKKRGAGSIIFYQIINWLKLNHSYKYLCDSAWGYLVVGTEPFGEAFA